MYVSMYVGTQACSYVGMRHAGMSVCRYVSMYVCMYVGLKSCKESIGFCKHMRGWFTTAKVVVRFPSIAAVSYAPKLHFDAIKQPPQSKFQPPTASNSIP